MTVTGSPTTTITGTMNTAASATTNADPGSITADPATTSHLTDATNSFTTVTAYANAIANIILNPATDPPAAWFNTLGTALTLAQTHVRTWVEVLGPQMSSNVPQTIIDYGNLFAAAAQDIISVLQASGNNPNAAQRQQILGDISTLQQFITTEQGVISGLQTQLKAFQDNVLNDHNSLSSGANAAQTALNLDDATIASIQAQIAAVQADLLAATQKATASEIGIGLAIFIGIVAVVAVIATGGAAAPLVVGAVAVIGLGAAIATTVIYSKQQADDQEKLTDLTAELTSDQAQAASLSAILNTTQTIVTANEAASAALDNLAGVWSDLLTKTNSVANDLANADKAGDGVHFGAFAVRLWTKDALAAWNQLVTFATNMQTALLGTTVSNVSQAQAA